MSQNINKTVFATGTTIALLGTLVWPTWCARRAVEAAEELTSSEGLRVEHAHTLGSRRGRHPAEAMCLAVSHDGSLAATGCPDGSLYLWDGEDLALRSRVVDDGWCMEALAFDSTRRLLAAGGFGRRLWVWDVGEELRLRSTRSTAAAIFSLAFLKAEGTIAAGLESGWVQLLKVNGSELKLLASRKCHDDIVTAIVPSSDGCTVYTASFDGYVKTWDGLLEASSPEKTMAVRDHVMSLAVDSQKKRVLIGTSSAEIQVWDASGEKPELQLSKEDKEGGGITGVAFCSKARFVTGQSFGGVKLWEIADDGVRHVRELATAMDTVTGLAVRPAGQAERLWFSSRDGRIRLVGAIEGKGEDAPSSRSTDDALVESVAVVDPELCVVGCRDGTVLALEVTGAGPRDPVALWSRGSRVISVDAWKADGKMFVAASFDDDRVRVAEVVQGAARMVAAWREPFGPVYSMRAMAEDRSLVYALRGSRSLVIRGIEDPGAPIRTVLFSAVADLGQNAVHGSGDGLHCAVLDDGSINLRRRGVGGSVAVIPGDFRCVWSCPGSPLFAAGSGQGEVVVWTLGDNEPKELREVLRVRPHEGPVSSIGGGRDGTALISGGRDGIVSLREIPGGRLLWVSKADEAVAQVACDRGVRLLATVYVDGILVLSRIRWDE